jgi:ribosomal protein L37E
MPLFKKVLKKTKTHIIARNNAGVMIKCRKCKFRSYVPEHVQAKKCPNCGMGWE